MSNFANLLGPLNLWASLPSFLLYYLFYSSFEHSDPEGPVKDTKVKTFKKKHLNFILHDGTDFFGWLLSLKTQLLQCRQTGYSNCILFIYFFFLLKELVESR